MKSSKFILAFFFTLTSYISFSQKENILKDINTQLWTNFTKAFETKDSNLFESLHSKEMIRVNGDRNSIRQKSEYIDRYKTYWQNSSDKKETISFRFTERIYNDSLASERGIYRYTSDLGTEKEMASYGKFHVLLKKENNVWKILMDYDSNENNTINKETYQKAMHIGDFSKF